MNIRRYLRLYGYFLRFSLMKGLHFRMEFFMRSGMDVVYYAIAIAFYSVLFQHRETIGGWTEDQAFVFIGAYLFVDAFDMTFFATNLWALPTLVNRGGLDYYLVRPVSPLFCITMREFSLSSFMNLLMALGLLVYAIVVYPHPLGITQFVSFGIFLFLGALMHVCIRILFGLPIFWAHSSRGPEILFYLLTEFTERPHRIFSGAIGIALRTVLPFSLMASLPTAILFEGLRPVYLANMVAVSIALCLMLRFVWTRALGAYSSASS